MIDESETLCCVSSFGLPLVYLVSIFFNLKIAFTTKFLCMNSQTSAVEQFPQTTSITPYSIEARFAK